MTAYRMVFSLSAGNKEFFSCMERGPVVSSLNIKTGRQNNMSILYSSETAIPCDSESGRAGSVNQPVLLNYNADARAV